MLAELDGISDCNQAEVFKHMKIWVPHDNVEVDEDEYLWDDLIGCEVRQSDGSLLGSVKALEEYGAQDILVVETAPGTQPAGEWMLPFIEEVVLNVDLEKRCVTVALPEGIDACFTPRF